MAANFFNVYPMAVVFALLAPNSIDFETVGFALVVMCALNTFLASYYAHKLACRYFDMSFMIGALVGMFFGFSYYTTSTLGQIPFLFSFAPLPWIAYQALTFAGAPSLFRLLWAALPVMLSVLGGYPPIGIACCAASTFLVLLHIVLFDEAACSWKLRILALMRSAMPYVVAALVSAPYLYLMLAFNKETGSASSPSLFFSAHQLAERPESILRALSQSYSVPGPFYEFTPRIGIPAGLVMLLFFCGLDASRALTIRESRLLIICGAVYASSVLAIYGMFSPVSNLFFHFAPIVGKMHIYQRFLPVTNLFFGLAFALMLKAVVFSRPLRALRLAWLLTVGLTVMLAFLVSHQIPVVEGVRLDGFLVFELMLGILMVTVLLLPGATMTIGAAIVILFLGPLGTMYTLTQGNNGRAVQAARIPLSLDESMKRGLAEYMKANSDKEIVKYVDLTPFWAPDGVETFPKTFPYLVLDDLKLVSYGGFSFYLDARADYMSTMPITGADVAMKPDWQKVLAQGGDFAVVLSRQLAQGDATGLTSILDMEKAFPLPRDALMVPIRRDAGSPGSRIPAFDNGMFRVVPGGLEDEAPRPNVALGKPARQSGGGDAGLAVDGNTDGDYGNRSVTHTASDPNAWLEVDFGKSESIDSVVLWNRTDCCGERLGDPWVFLSDRPFPVQATASDLSSTPGVTGRRLLSAAKRTSRVDIGGATARYVRVQLSGSQDPGASFLSLAELQVFPGEPEPSDVAAVADISVSDFQTNFANDSSLTIEASAPSTLHYLFSANPRLSFWINGRFATPTVTADGVLAFDLPTGRSEVRAIYTNRTLLLFWMIYAGYLLLMAISPVLDRAFLSNRHRSRLWT